MTMRLLITGGQGFVGKALVDSAILRGLTVRVSSRQNLITTDRRLEYCQTGELGAATDWSVALQGVDTLVHCAARVHVLNDVASDPLAEFRVVNVEGTLNLARQAAKVGIRRFIFLSSIGVNGNATHGVAFDEASKPAPHSIYACSKHEAEQGLQEIASKASMGIVIVRPPLVYGPNAPGNFAKLIKFISKSYPCPLGAIRNLRSFISIYNLVDFILTCLDHPTAANQTFLVSDGEDLSTTDLLRRMALALNVPLRLLPIPQMFIENGLMLVGKTELAQRLCSSLQIDISKARTLLSWNPPISVDEGLHRTAQWFLHEKNI